MRPYFSAERLGSTFYADGGVEDHAETRRINPEMHAAKRKGGGHPSDARPASCPAPLDKPYTYLTVYIPQVDCDRLHCTPAAICADTSAVRTSPALKLTLRCDWDTFLGSGPQSTSFRPS